MTISEQLKVALEHLAMFIDGIEGAPDKSQQNAIDFLEEAKLYYSSDLIVCNGESERVNVPNGSRIEMSSKAHKMLRADNGTRITINICESETTGKKVGDILHLLRGVGIR